MMEVLAATEHLPGSLHALEPALDSYGYLAVVAFVMLEDFGIPVPGETVLILGAVYAGTGRLSLPLVVLLGFIAAVIGDNIGFAAGHLGGRPVAERFGRFVLLTPARLTRATETFDRHGGKIITVARFVEGLRQANGIIAGIAGVSWRRFLAYNALGAALWVVAWTSVGYFAGSHIGSVYDTATRYDTYLAIAAAVALLAWLTRHLLMRGRGRSARTTMASPLEFRRTRAPTVEAAELRRTRRGR